MKLKDLKEALANIEDGEIECMINVNGMFHDLDIVKIDEDGDLIFIEL